MLDPQQNKCFAGWNTLKMVGSCNWWTLRYYTNNNQIFALCVCSRWYMF